MLNKLRYLVLSTLALAGAAHAQTITGAGATFPAPVYTAWGEEYNKAFGISLNYQAIGSGAGVAQIINRTVDFGASDTPVDAEKLKANKLIQFPTVIGGVVLIVNLPGIDGNKLKLTGPIVADMYQGKIRMWNDPAIKALNAGVSLPALAISTAYRADSSGTTNIFTSYLSGVSETFKASLGAANSVAWKVGVGFPGNAGIAGFVKTSKGSIGYVEYAYAVGEKLPIPMLQNRAGKFVAATVPSFEAAANQADWKAATVNMLNLTGDKTWPIVSATYILVPTNPTNPGAAKNLFTFLDWAFKKGSPTAAKLNYIPLPSAVQNQSRKKWAEVLDNFNKPVWK